MRRFIDIRYLHILYATVVKSYYMHHHMTLTQSSKRLHGVGGVSDDTIQLVCSAQRNAVSSVFVLPA